MTQKLQLQCRPTPNMSFLGSLFRCLWEIQESSKHWSAGLPLFMCFEYIKNKPQRFATSSH